MDPHHLFYLNGLKRLGILAATVYTLQGNREHALAMHQMVLSLIAIKWTTWLYSKW